MGRDAVKKSIFKRWWFWAIVALIAVIALSGMNNDTTPKNVADNRTTTQNTTGVQDTTPTETQEQTVQQDQTGQAEQKGAAADEGGGALKEGMYKIGTDLKAGEYILLSEGVMPAYYQVTTDSTGSLESIISNDNFYGNRYITVADGQYLEYRDAIGYPAEGASALEPKDGRYSEGMYKVGKDIKAGEYKVIPEEGAISSYIEIAKNSKGILDSIVSNDNFQAEKYTTIKDGQYIKLVGCYIEVK